MNSRNNSYRGFGFYLVLILIVVGVWYFLDGNTTTNSYTRAAFEKDIQSGDVTAIDIVQNREIPTGSVNLTFLDSTQKVLIVSDVNEIVSYLQDQDITYYTMENVPAESWIMTLLPYLIIFGILAPSAVYFCGARRKSTISSNSSFSSFKRGRRQQQDDEFW